MGHHDDEVLRFFNRPASIAAVVTILAIDAAFFTETWREACGHFS